MITTIKVPEVLQTKAVVFQTRNTSRYMTAEEADAAFAYVVEHCVVTGARPAQPLTWIRLPKEN